MLYTRQSRSDQIARVTSVLSTPSPIGGSIMTVCWLHALVTPVFKKGLTSDPVNYRPISLTCVCCRVMERIINVELLDYLLQHSLISKYQHGFLYKHSTCSNLLESVNDWAVALNSRYTTVCLSVCLSVREHIFGTKRLILAIIFFTR